MKSYTSDDFMKEYGLLDSGKRILNAGSASRRYGTNCVNVDIQAKPNVDVVCDLHALPDSLGLFDAIICSAVLQYCKNPQQVADQFYGHLKPGGFLYVNAPWVQPYCTDMPDLFRYSQDGLQYIFSEFEIVKIGIAIRPGSAFAMLGVHIAQTMTCNKYVNFLLRNLVTLAFLPLTPIRTCDEQRTAGAFYLIARKPL